MFLGRYFIVFCLLWISLGNGTLAFASCFKCGDDFKIGFGEVSRSLSWIYYTEPATFSDNQKLWIDNFSHQFHFMMKVTWVRVTDGESWILMSDILKWRSVPISHHSF